MAALKIDEASNPPALEPSEDLGMPLALLGLVIPHGICTLFILARMVSRLILLKKWFIDDSLIIAAYLFSTAVCVIYSIASQRPDVLYADEKAMQESLDEEDWPVHPYILRTYLGLLFYQVCLCLNKFSILSFYLRIFSSSPRHRMVVWGTMVFVALYGIPMLFMSLFQCHPVQGQFFGTPMFCFNLTDLLISSTTFHAITDAWLILLIMPSVSGLDIPTKQKITLSVVLNFGIFVITAGVVRLMLSLRKNYRPDMVGVTATLAFFIMTVLECDLAIICATAPTLRPLFAKFWPWIMHDARRRSLQPNRNRNNNNINSNGLDTNNRPRLPASYASVDLTSQVSYHGYPWTEPNTPLGRSRNPSVGSHLNRFGSSKAAVPASPRPPVPALNISNPTPTSLSLRSIMMSGKAAASRVRPAEGDEALTSSAASDGRPILDESRPVSFAMSGLTAGGGGGGGGGDFAGGPSPVTSSPLDTPRQQPGHVSTKLRQSQESLVVGLNDPMTPTVASSPNNEYGYGDEPQYPTLMDFWERSPRSRWEIGHDKDKGENV